MRFSSKLLDWAVGSGGVLALHHMQVLLLGSDKHMRLLSLEVDELLGAVPDIVHSRSVHDISVHEPQNKANTDMVVSFTSANPRLAWSDLAA